MVKKNKSVEKVTSLCLLTNGEIQEFRIPKSLDVDKIDLNKFPMSVLQSLGKGVVERECDFTYNDKILSIFAWSDGKAGTENKHDLPPPIDNELYYGNIFAIYHEKGKLLNLSKNDYNDFYEIAFGGFESLGSEDTWSTEEEIDSNDSLNDFIVNDSENSEKSYDGSSENDKSLTSGSDTTVSELSMTSGSDESKNVKN